MEKKTEKNNIYVVKKGDSYSKIARMFGTTVEELQKKNKIRNVNIIRVGQKVKY